MPEGVGIDLEADRSVDTTEPTAREMAGRRPRVWAGCEATAELSPCAQVVHAARDPTTAAVDGDGSVESTRPEGIEVDFHSVTHLAGLEAIPRPEPQIHRRIRQVGDHFVEVEVR